MASDGKIDEREVALIKLLSQESALFSDSELQEITNGFLIEINANLQSFIGDYFRILKTTELTEKQELNLIDFAIKMIKADELIEYSEIKFFKVIRNCLKSNDQTILNAHPGIESFLENDIGMENSIEKLTNQYFESAHLEDFKPTFDPSISLNFLS